ncbi:MAG: triosephosphate isomerase, partial [Bacteroidia bacterium]
MRKNIVAGNWKMNMTRETGLALVDEIYQGLNSRTVSNVKVVLAPPFPFLFETRDWINDDNVISLSAQNCHQEKNGAFTGEVSAESLASYDCEYCIVGHSERRQY